MTPPTDWSERARELVLRHVHMIVNGEPKVDSLDKLIEDVANALGEAAAGREGIYKPHCARCGVDDDHGMPPMLVCGKCSTTLAASDATREAAMRDALACVVEWFDCPCTAVNISWNDAMQFCQRTDGHKGPRGHKEHVRRTVDSALAGGGEVKDDPNFSCDHDMGVCRKDFGMMCDFKESPVEKPEERCAAKVGGMLCGWPRAHAIHKQDEWRGDLSHDYQPPTPAPAVGEATHECCAFCYTQDHVRRHHKHSFLCGEATPPSTVARSEASAVSVAECILCKQGVRDVHEHIKAVPVTGDDLRCAEAVQHAEWLRKLADTIETVEAKRGGRWWPNAGTLAKFRAIAALLDEGSR